MKNRKVVVWVLLLTSTVWTAGCGGPKRYPVAGTIQLGDEPLAKAVVTFMPTGETSADPAVGNTDEQGRYALLQSPDAKGVTEGTYIVRVTTFRDPHPYDDPPDPGAPERVPRVYNIDSKLMVSVPNDSGSYDFQLDDGGPIFTPASDE